MSLPRSFLDPWLASLPPPTSSPTDPSAAALVSTSIPRALTTGSGLDIFTNTLVPAILSARHEILFVTCFLANPSPSLTALSNALTTLATLRAASPSPLPPLRVRLGFSSRSPLQRLFHTFSKTGHVYPEEKWSSLLGLPAPETLRPAGIELGVKSLFFNPLGILHPKFVVVDRAAAWMPSCNVSWECWFEGCVEVRGDVVGRLVEFWAHVWGRGEGWQLSEKGWRDEDAEIVQETPRPSDQANSPTRTVHLDTDTSPVATVLLPSTWHFNPRFQPIPFLPAFPPPSTPLNTALLTLFAQAKTSISIITPNITCPAVLDALVSALDRGVDVRIRTSRGMMVLEQLVTAGTTTGRCLARLRRRHASLSTKRSPTTPTAWWRRFLPWKRPRASVDVEAARTPITPGTLTIQHYTPDPTWHGQADEPVFSHLKLTLVDGRFLVLGSGNMDRASWYTSQELGVLFYSPGGFGDWEPAWEGPLAARVEGL